MKDKLDSFEILLKETDSEIKVLKEKMDKIKERVIENDNKIRILENKNDECSESESASSFSQVNSIEPAKDTAVTFNCDECDFSCKRKAGLTIH